MSEMRTSPHTGMPSGEPRIGSVPRKQRLVIIGNGMAGGRFVEEVIARGGAEQFEIVMFGEEGHGNYNRVLLSSVLAGTHAPGDIFINSVEWYEQNGIKLYSGVRAGWIDRVSKSVYAPGGIAEPYDKLVIATGSGAYVPPMANLYNEDGGFIEGIFVFRTLEDCQQMTAYAARLSGHGSKVAVIGGGLLGLEAARGLMGKGLEVHVVHLNSHLMDTQLDAEAGRMLKQQMEDLGVNIHLDKMTTAISTEPSSRSEGLAPYGHAGPGAADSIRPSTGGRVTGLSFRDGEELDCDMVVLAAGIRPNVDLAKQAGLQVQQGIVVNNDLSCRNDQDVYAIGECAQHRGRLYGTITPVWEQAVILADRLTGHNPDASYQGSRVSTKLKVMDVELAVMGDKAPLSDADELVNYSEPGRGVYKKLIIREGRLAGAILLGDGLTSAGVIQAYDRNSELPANRSELIFPSTAGKTLDVAELPVNAQICNCNGVSKGRIAEAVQDGMITLQEVCSATRAGTGCGTCKTQVQAVLDFAISSSAGGSPQQAEPAERELALAGAH